jgi:hypothetical protein
LARTLPARPEPDEYRVNAEHADYYDDGGDEQEGAHRCPLAIASPGLPVASSRAGRCIPAGGALATTGYATTLPLALTMLCLMAGLLTYRSRLQAARQY